MNIAANALAIFYLAFGAAAWLNVHYERAAARLLTVSSIATSEPIATAAPYPIERWKLRPLPTTPPYPPHTPRRTAKQVKK